MKGRLAFRRMFSASFGRWEISFREPDERGDELWIVFATRFFPKDAGCVGRMVRRRPVVDEMVEIVGDRANAGEQVNVLTVEPFRIAAAVDSFVMLKCYVRTEQRKFGMFPEKMKAIPDVRFRSAFVGQCVADVVKKGAERQLLELKHVEAQPGSQKRG